MTPLQTASRLEPDIVYVRDRQVACTGGDGALGHPKVYYSLADGEAVCEYCGRKFVFDPERAPARP